MKKQSQILKFALATIFLISCGALVALGGEKNVRKPKPKMASIIHKAKAPGYDKNLLEKFMTTIHSLDFNKRSCTYSGVINLIDGEDTAKSVRNLQFRFCRSGDDYYYRVGHTEIIHQRNLNVCVLHDQKKVVLSNRAIEIKPPVQDMDQVEKAIQSEHYELESSLKGTRQTLSLINEHHVSCKQLSVTRDTVSGKLVRIFMRSTNLASPMDKHKERTMEVNISEISNKGNLEAFPSTDEILEKRHNQWQLLGKCKNYELIML